MLMKQRNNQFVYKEWYSWGLPLVGFVSSILLAVFAFWCLALAWSGVMVLVNLGLLPDTHSWYDPSMDVPPVWMLATVFLLAYPFFALLILKAWFHSIEYDPDAGQLRSRPLIGTGLQLPLARIEALLLQTRHQLLMRKYNPGIRVEGKMNQDQFMTEIWMLARIKAKDGEEPQVVQLWKTREAEGSQDLVKELSAHSGIAWEKETLHLDPKGNALPAADSAKN